MTKKRARPVVTDPSEAGADTKKDNMQKVSPKKQGWDEIESLFDKKKDQKELDKLEHAEQKKLDEERRKKRKAQRTTTASSASNTVFGAGDAWVDDGLGGKYNTEGYTGRVVDGVKVFKAHILSKPGAGSTKQCPFDCDCCYM